MNRIHASTRTGIGRGVRSMKKDVLLGDIVVSKPTAARPGLIQYDMERLRA